MNVLLINPYCLDPRLQDYDIKVPPIGLYYIGANLLANGHKCTILNYYNMQGKREIIENEIKTFRPDLIGISILHANRWGGIDIARISKACFPHVPVVFGGPGASFLRRHLLTNFKEIDYIVLGEGENTMLSVADLLKEGRVKDISEIPGLAFRRGGEIVKNEPEPFIQPLDSLPDPSQYFSFQHVVSSRGCPWNCAFCGSPRIWKRKVRFHSPGYFVAQLENLKRSGVNFFYVSDDTFTLQKERVLEICRLIIEKDLNITWAAISRVNHVDEEILYWMRRAGCMQISYGVESGSPRIRKTLNKNISDKQIQDAFELTSSHGLMPRAYFIYGSPGETKKTIKESIRLMERIHPLSAIFYILDIFPGTALYDRFRKRTGADDDIWLKRVEDIMYFETDPSLSRESVLNFGRRLRKAFYKNLPRFANSVKLVNKKEMYPLHADFLSRLGMTFGFGDYAGIKDIAHPQSVAEGLFRRALEYHPDHRAFLGLAMLLQRRGLHQDALEVLDTGLKNFPDSKELLTCKGISLMHTGRMERALEIFLNNGSDRQSLEYAGYCARSLGRHDLVRDILFRLDSLGNSNPS